MKSVAIAVAGLAAAASAAPHVARADDCSPSYDGTFKIVISEPVSKRALVARADLELTLKDGILKDAEGRTGYIASNHQFQFDAPPQGNALVTEGFSACADGYLALDGSKAFKRCLSGDFYNLYDNEADAEHCEPIAFAIMGGGSSSGGGSSQQPTQIGDGQVQGPSGAPVSQIPDGQVQGPSGAPVSQIDDGQVQAPTGAPATQIGDGQVQAPTGAPVTQIDDGQVQAPTGAPVTQIDDGQVQAPTGAPVTQIDDGQVQAPTGAPVTQIDDGQVQAPTGAPVTQIDDGQVQAPTGVAPPANSTVPQVSSPPTVPEGAASKALPGVAGALLVGFIGAVMCL